MAEQPAFLYVEDHPASHMVMRIMLQKLLGYADLTIMESTENFIQTVEAFNKTFDIIFLDLNMKPHDGYTICRILRSHQDLTKASIVALTATVIPDDEAKLKASGFNGVLYKPIYPDQFSRLISRLLNGETLWKV